MILEACVESLKEARLAQEKGAHRIELCSRLDLDGLTPDPELIREVCLELNIPVMVMIRPREGDFVLRSDEMIRMRREIAMAKRMGASGFVFGLLTPDNQIDLNACRELLFAAAPLPVTFHKAIDSLADPVEGIRQLSTLKGLKRVLTSGGKATALEGASVIREMIGVSAGKLTVLAAGKITPENIQQIAELTGAREFHGRKIVGELT
jgi:copper homeostasis protein